MLLHSNSAWIYGAYLPHRPWARRFVYLVTDGITFLPPQKRWPSFSQTAHYRNHWHSLNLSRWSFVLCSCKFSPNKYLDFRKGVTPLDGVTQGIPSPAYCLPPSDATGSFLVFFWCFLLIIVVLVVCTSVFVCNKDSVSKVTNYVSSGTLFSMQSYHNITTPVARYHIILLGDRCICMCEQLAQSRHVTVRWLEFEPVTSDVPKLHSFCMYMHTLFRSCYWWYFALHCTWLGIVL